jgi:hypothetical protein
MGMPVYNPPSRFLRDVPAQLTEDGAACDFAVRRQAPERRLPRPGRVAVSAAEVAAADGGGRTFGSAMRATPGSATVSSSRRATTRATRR